jgi:hypothetical protein
MSPDENQNTSSNTNTKTVKTKVPKKLAVEEPAAPAALMTSQPTKDQMLAEIDNLLSDDSDSD